MRGFSGHWKLWRDMSGRFYAACLIIGWQIFSMQGGVSLDKKVFSTSHFAYRPEICRPAMLGEVAASRQIAILHERELVNHERGMISAEAYRQQAAFCTGSERPTEAYVKRVESWITTYRESIWYGVMPMLMLFLGIMISVGPPFSGESAEANTLTFSLPWSRPKWLFEKVKLSSLLVVGLIAPVFVVSAMATSFPEAEQLGRLTYDGIDMFSVIPSILTGIVGVTLGVSATMLTRSALAGAICASIVAYLLTMVNVSRFVPSDLMDSFFVMDVTQPAGIVIALAVIAGAIMLTYSRLENTDF